MNLKNNINLTISGGGYSLGSQQDSKQNIRLLNSFASWNKGGYYVLD